VLKRHFSMLPRSVRREAVLCLGQMTLHWRGLGAAGEGGTADGGAGSSGSVVAAVGFSATGGMGPAGSSMGAPPSRHLDAAARLPVGEGRPRGHRPHGVVQRRREEHEGYAGDKSEAGSSGDEHELRSSMRGILPMLSGVAHGVMSATPQPNANAFTLDQLVARGGTPLCPQPTAAEATGADDDWL